MFMAEQAKTKCVINVYYEPSIDSALVTQINKESNVAVIEHGLLFSRIVFNEYEGFCETRNLTFENGDVNTRHKETKITISIPVECACELYNALKFSLKT